MNTSSKPATTVTTLGRFAEYLAQGLSVETAAERLGKSNDYGRAMLYRMRRSLGPQAV